MRHRISFVGLGQQDHRAQEVRIVRTELVQLEDVVEERGPLAAAPAVCALKIRDDVLARAVEERTKPHFLGFQLLASVSVSTWRYVRRTWYGETVAPRRQSSAAAELVATRP